MAASASPVQGSLLLTLGFDRPNQAALESLRRAAWPEARPGVPAHLTLFRQLPGGQAPAIVAEIRTELRGRQPFPVLFLPPRARGDAVFLPARGEDLLDLHGALRHRLFALLRPQERLEPDLHVTLAAGRSPRDAADLAGKLGRAPVPVLARAEALLLWRLAQPAGPTGAAALVRDPPWSLLVSLRLGR